MLSQELSLTHHGDKQDFGRYLSVSWLLGLEPLGG
jgi:hypothetical protein